MQPDYCDVSHYQQGVDLGAYKAAGYTYLLMKSSEGHGYVDPMWAPRADRARQLGLRLGAYHFVDSTGEAPHFLATVQPYMDVIDRLVIDYEAGTPAAACVDLMVALEQANTGKTLELYSGVYKIANDGHGAALPYRAGWEWTCASYSKQMPPAPKGWPPPTRWQYADNGTVPGISTPCDVNRILTPTPAPHPDLESAMSVSLITGNGGNVAVVDGFPFVVANQNTLNQVNAAVAKTGGSTLTIANPEMQRISAAINARDGVTSAK